MPTLRLTPDQTAALQAIRHERDLAQLAGALAAVFPEVAARSGERYAGLIAHGVERGAAQGLDHAACVGRYLACWFLLGAAFETRPEHAWARDLLAATDRPQGSRVFQLCRRTREALAQREAASRGAEPAGAALAFDRALVALDAMLQPRGTLGSLLPPRPIALGEACDVDAIDLRLVEPDAARRPHRYRLEDGTQWRRLPRETLPVSLTVTTDTAAPNAARQAAPGLPPRLNVVGHRAEHGHVRLRVRTRCAHCCDPRVHPLITFNDGQGLASWRGAHAADVLLDLHAAPAEAPADDGPQPVIGRETGAQWGELALASCGLRETGAALGEQRTRVAVYPGEQHWMVWRRESGAPQEWPEAGPPPALPAALYRIERDGLPLESSRWLAGLQELDRQLGEGLARLATAWERESGVSDGHLRCEPAVMSGGAALTWGWTEGGDALTDLPCHRLAGTLDLVVCRLGLRLSGALALQGSSSRLVLRCDDTATLTTRFERRPADTDPTAFMQGARIAFRQPFTLALEALAPAGDVAVLDAAGPVVGALVGAGGLRPRADGAGWQWFCELRIEPVSVALRLNDPLLGVQTLTRPLLPALVLLDWSLG